MFSMVERYFSSLRFLFRNFIMRVEIKYYKSAEAILIFLKKIYKLKYFMTQDERFRHLRPDIFREKYMSPFQIENICHIFEELLGNVRDIIHDI